VHDHAKLEVKLILLALINDKIHLIFNRLVDREKSLLDYMLNITLETDRCNSFESFI
jgi:hypothetical protein